MRTAGDLQTGEQVVLLQAAAIVGATVRQTLADALRAAAGCGCHPCRTRAAHTVLWAVGMMTTADAASDP